MKRILAVLQLRNEEEHLPGCLEHLRGFVDGVVALDDASEDGTAAILARDPAVIGVISKPSTAEHRWDELGNKRALLEQARVLGADWVLCVDADERLERGFLSELRAIVSNLSDVRVAIWCRELWDRPDHYRVDGVWGNASKFRVRLFPLPATLAFENNQALHGRWEPDVVQRLPLRRFDKNFYHLKMIRRDDRIARRDFYNRCDPDRRFQAIGYDYLDDETGLTLTQIPRGREYDYATLSPALRALLDGSHADR